MVLTEGGTSQQLHTKPRKCTLFKLIQQSNKYGHWSHRVASPRKIKIRSRGKKVQFITESGGLWQKTQLSVINWTFLLEFKFWFFFTRQLRMSILGCCISLKIIKKNLVVLGVVDMRQLLLKVSCKIQWPKNCTSVWSDSNWKTRIVTFSRTV